MIAKEPIQSIVEDFVQGTDMFLVDIKISASNQIEVFIDADSRVLIDQCITLSKHIEEALDRDVEDFSLNVSSAGLDMPLILPRQYTKYIGKDLSILCNDGVKYEATLDEATEEDVKLSYQVKELVEGKKRKQLVDKELELKYTDIKTTFVIISFK